MSKKSGVRTTYHTVISSPIGEILLTADEKGLTGINFQDARGARTPPSDSIKSAAPFKEAARQLKAYFRGELYKFDIPLSVKGTVFQLRVWKALSTIPYGKTVSYGEVAKRIGRPAASRAVGAANRSNPLPIVLPCHRVIGSDGRLTGNAGGLHLKEYLLKLEKGRE
jgi:methylated-DNA-[protein]-cysteine S-methyltransferase